MCAGYSSPEGVASPVAAQYDHMSMGNRGVPCKLFVGGVSAHTTTEALRGHFSKYGRIIDAVVMQKNGRPRGFGFVTFDHPLPAECALAEAQWLDGRLVDVKRAVPGERAQERTSNKIFVGGLPQDVSTEELRAYFSGYGSVADAVVMVDRRTNRSRGFGFVRFGNGASGNAASEAVLMDFASHRLAGKWVEVKRATPASQLQDMFPCDGLEEEMYGMTADELMACASMGMPLECLSMAGWDSSPCGDSTPLSMHGLDASSGGSTRSSHARGRRARRRKQKTGSNGDLEDLSDDASPTADSLCMPMPDMPLGEVAFVSTSNVASPITTPTSVDSSLPEAPNGDAWDSRNKARALADRPLAAAGGGQRQRGGVKSTPGTSENDPNRANAPSSADQPMKVIACREAEGFTREDFLSLEVRPWLSAW